MMGEAMEFHISGSVRGESGLLSIIGRCGDEAVRPGTKFRAIFRNKPREYPDGLEAPPEVEECRDLCVTVKEVESYGKTVDVLPPNMTGVLRCIDSSVELVPGGWVLTDQCVSAKAKAVH